MSSRLMLSGIALLILLGGSCAKKQAQAPPPAPVPTPKQNIFALLPEPSGKPSRIVVSNSGGSAEIAEDNYAVRIERMDAAPTSPYSLDQETVRRLFGAALDALPPAEVQYLLYFDEGRDDLTADSLAQLGAILQTATERRSTAVTVIGHTDTTGDAQSNYQLGMRRAQRVANFLRERGLDSSSLFVDSHGEADLLVKTPRGQAEQRNRRVEVIVR